MVVVLTVDCALQDTLSVADNKVGPPQTPTAIEFIALPATIRQKRLVAGQ
jgi:hypothetical protein